MLSSKHQDGRHVLACSIGKRRTLDGDCQLNNLRQCLEKAPDNVINGLVHQQLLQKSSSLVAIPLQSHSSGFQVANQSTSEAAPKHYNRSRDQRFCDHDRKHNFDRAIWCTKIHGDFVTLPPDA